MRQPHPSPGIQAPRVLGIVLARGGSKGIPRKNVRPLAGIPLIAHTIREGLKSAFMTRLIVSTDDAEIASVAREWGADVPFRRPSELSTDTASSKDCLQHAVTVMEAEERRSYDYVIELMCTNPLKTVADIDAVMEKLIDTGADSVIGVVQVEDHHPARIKKIIDDRIVDFCVPEPLDARRQDLTPPAFIRNGSIYAMRRDSLMVDGYRYGSADSRPYIFQPERSVNVDTDADWSRAEWLLGHRSKLESA